MVIHDYLTFLLVKHTLMLLALFCANVIWPNVVMFNIKNKWINIIASTIGGYAIVATVYHLGWFIFTQFCYAQQ